MTDAFQNQIDKRLHFAVSCALTLALCFVKGVVWWQAALVVLAIGIAKEAADYMLKIGTPDWLDLVADVAGILAAGAWLKIVGL